MTTDKDMIISFKGSQGFCELTEDMDTYLLGKRPVFFRTYMYDFGSRSDGQAGHIYVMRAPGATRGCIYLDEHDVIEKVMFYKDSCYEKIKTYDRSMEQIKDKYVGRKVVVQK